MKHTHHFKSSTSIASIHHDGDCLHITFQSGKTYKYKDCGHDHYEGMKGSESPGKYFFKKIRGVYNHELVEE